MQIRNKITYMITTSNPTGKKNTQFEWVLLILLVVGYYSWLSVNTVYSASVDGRLLEVFDGDEFSHFDIVSKALTNHTLCVEWTVYGHFYFNIVLFPLFILQRFTPVSDQLLVLVLRYVSTLSSILTVIMTFGLAKRYFDSFVAWISSIFLMIVPYIFNYWSVTSHPDTLQMFTIVCGMFACCEYLLSKKNKWLIIAAFFAGMAFSTKYAGIFLMPIIWFLCFGIFVEPIKKIKRDFLHLPSLLQAFWLVFITGVSFLIAFALASPCLVLDLKFFPGLIRVVQVTSSGYLYQINHRRIEWFEVLSSTSLLGVLNSVLLAFALAWFIFKTWKTKGEELQSPKGLLWVWVLFYFAVAFFSANVRENRYLLVIIPFIFILLADFLVSVLDYIGRKFSRKFVFHFMFGAIVVFGVLELWEGVLRQLELIETRQTRENNNPVIEAGKWLEVNYQPSSRILYDKYSYVPSKFTQVWGTYNMDATLVEDVKPRVIVINSSIRDIFRDSYMANSYVDGPERFMEIHDFYDALEAEQLGYVLVADFGSVRIYQKER